MIISEKGARSPFAEAAPLLVSMGFSVVPIAPRQDEDEEHGIRGLTGKAPGEYTRGAWRPMYEWDRFSRRSNTPIELDLWSDWPNAGIGIVTGSRCSVRGVDYQVVAIDIDLRDLEAVEDLKRALPYSPMAKFGSKGTTQFYRADPEMTSKSWSVNKRTIVELLTGNATRQTVCPPTIHPDTQKPYRWTSGPVHVRELPILTQADLDAFEESLEKFGYVPPSRDNQPLSPNVIRFAGKLAGPHAELNASAMDRLSEWVPFLNLHSLKRERGRYSAIADWRPSSTGRPLEKRKRNLSIHPAGIKDFGTSETYSPLDLVMRARRCQLAEAFIWLDNLMNGIPPEVTITAPPSAPKRPEAPPLEEEQSEKASPPEEEQESNAPPAVPKAPPLAPPLATSGAPKDHVLPLELAYPKGLVGSIAQWMVDTASKPQPALALAAALCIVGTAAGRHIAGPTRTGTHIYAIGLAPSGGGKDHLLKRTGQIMIESGMRAYLGPNNFISSTALINVLRSSPITLSVIDEMGSFFARINNRKAGGFERDVSALLRSAWGSSFGAMPTPEWANRKSEIIYAPALSVLGASTTHEFFAALTGMDTTNGMLNRFLAFPALIRPKQVKPALDYETVPEAIKVGLRMIMNCSGPMVAATINAYDSDPARIMKRCGWGPGAESVWQSFVNEIDEKGDHDHVYASAWSRAAEYAQRLATIVAIGRKGDVADLELEDINWAIAVVRWSFEYVTEAASDHIADTEAQARAQEVIRILKSEKGRTTSRQLFKRLGHKYSMRDIKDTLESLQEGGRVEAQEIKPPRGRTSYVYTLIEEEKA